MVTFNMKKLMVTVFAALRLLLVANLTEKVCKRPR